ncbi:dihydrolipoamide acetyltransferase family protein [Microcella sp.]|uniref:dihydrolipoamide acetyltransferase family protein n=1 Tax=Microcella sp. TaxID=1913979 RepID=UPI00256E7C46|nr:dihydrolipoamide acetyltransferase family protein [Microcella sp.]MBX9473069.1 2-oxo acid dehydrogenase subunit E2 [Microcella sp.]
MTAREFRLPDLGEGLTESELVEWHVAPGELVTLNQTIADVETAKAIVQLPSPVAGRVIELLAEPGTTVAVGTPIVRFEVEGAADSPAPDSASADEAAEGHAAETQKPESAHGSTSETTDAPVRNAVLVGYGPSVESGKRPQRKKRTFAAPTSVAQRPAAPRPVSSGHALALAAPPVRKLAHELGVDLATLQGTGENGMIVRADVTRAAEGSTPPTVAGAERTGEVRTPIRGVRKATAAAMVQSAFTAPHVTEFLTVDVTRSLQLVQRLTESGQRASLLGLVSKAVCMAIARTPSLNSRWDDEANEIVQFETVNLGIAVATDRGLMVPHITSADRRTLPELTAEIADLAAAARAGELAPSQLSGSTFTITNIGVFGVDAGTPILNPGEAGILAMGAVRRLPWEHEGEIALRDVITLSLSFDHRLVDGEQGARLLTDVGALLRDPATALAMV